MKVGEPSFWFVFGEYPDGVHVDVSDGERDVLVMVPRAEAERAIAEHNRAWEAWVDQHKGDARRSDNEGKGNGR